ncbi:MAG: hypothetical protein ACLURV_15050 [Gallintestinimicrobium sp.]
MEWKDGRLQLLNVTLMAMTSVNVRQTIKAMQYSMRQIDFGDCVLITHRKPFFLPKGIRYAHTSKLTNIDCLIIRCFMSLEIISIRILLWWLHGWVYRASGDVAG